MTRRSSRAPADWTALLEPAGLSGDLAGKIAGFLTLLFRWGGAVDLVGALDPTTLVGDVADSLAALAWLDPAGSMLDVGSGNGFPAIPLLLARPMLHGVLLEPRERRWAFLKEAVRELDLCADVRRERLAEHAAAGYTAMSVRGVAIDHWEPYAARVVREGGTVLWWTSADRAARLAGKATPGHVIHCPLPTPAHGSLAVWRQRST